MSAHRDPRKDARRQRAAERAAAHVCSETCRRNRKIPYADTWTTGRPGLRRPATERSAETR